MKLKLANLKFMILMLIYVVPYHFSTQVEKIVNTGFG